MPEIFVFDGHDAAGKTTLAALTARLVGGKVIKPFGDLLGDHIAWLWRNRKFEEADWLARSSIERVLSADDDVSIIFDRHWASMFSVLPQKYWTNWYPLPRTVICHTNAETTESRLRARGEDPLTRELHARYQKIYQKLGHDHGALVIDTTHATIEECMEEVRKHLVIGQL